MERELQENVKSFMTYDIEVTEENLLGAHRYGIDSFTAIAQAKDSDKLTSLLGEAANDPSFKGFDTVKSVKNYLNKQIKKGKDLTKV